MQKMLKIDSFETYRPSEIITNSTANIPMYFVTIAYDILCEQLDNCEVKAIMRALIKDYLGNRQHMVKFQETLKYFAIVRCSVPQGIVVGPIFFLVILII